MIGRTLGSYFARRFLRSILTIFAFACFIIFMFDFLENTRRYSDKPDASAALVFGLTLMRIPSMAEQVLPFATLFGAMASFLGLSRSLELVVARSAGVSVWQFTAPALGVAVAIGIFGTTVFNPVAAHLKDRADEIAVVLSGRNAGAQTSAAPAWLRQDGPEGESIVHAALSSDQGARLGEVTIMTFDETGRFKSRIDAVEARFEPGAWILTKATIRTEQAAPETHDTYRLPTFLTLEQIRESLSNPDTVPFWSLRTYIEIARNAGLPAFRYELQYQLLLARPLMLAAMVLIAGTVSLRVFRFGNVGRLILGGVTAGFVLYVAGEIARDLGGVGIVPPAIAAWTPAVVATLMGFTVLLYREDG